MPQLLRVGFLSTSNIGLKNASAAQLSGCIDLVAVASRNLASAQSYATENGFRKAYASYQELLDDEEVEAVYIPLPTTMHLEWVLKAAHAGKHVLCDKPVGVGLAQLVEMLKAVDGKNLVFMDGVMFMHHPRLPLLLKTLKDRDLFPEGPVSRVVTAFTFPGGGEFFKDNIRIKKELEPYGCVGDLGWYNVSRTNSIPLAPISRSPRPFYQRRSDSRSSHSTGPSPPTSAANPSPPPQKASPSPSLSASTSPTEIWQQATAASTTHFANGLNSHPRRPECTWMISCIRVRIMGAGLRCMRIRRRRRCRGLWERGRCK